ncbi:MAG TPA: hypothetical protein VJN93_00640 [Candidatus Acidoferrum sp.]|nr:hypothetical protein [Candidatus Acidoferrum sp.]
MSARRSIVRIAAKATMLFGAIFVVTLLLAAMPGHHAPVPEALPPQQATATSSSASSMPGMDMNDEKDSEKGAVEDMTPGQHRNAGLHMFMTELRPRQAGDAERAELVVEQLRTGIEKYKDYRVALADGYRIFLPNLPQPEYHFTNYRNGFLESFSFDPARPTSLLYKKNGGGYELVGAMYTMPRNASEDELNARIPLSIAMWHQHTNLCMPTLGHIRGADWTKFGLQGSIATQEACDAAGGRFHVVILGWMVHVYPYEAKLDKIFAMHMHMD